MSECTCQPGTYMARCAIHGDGARRTWVSRYGCTCATNPVRQQCPTHGYDDRMALLDFGDDEGDEPMDCTPLVGQEQHQAVIELLREARDMLDHRSFHTQPLEPATPCCDLERRIDEVLDARDRIVKERANG